MKDILSDGEDSISKDMVRDVLEDALGRKI